MRYHRSVIFLFLGLLGLLMVGGCATTDGENWEMPWNQPTQYEKSQDWLSFPL